LILFAHEFGKANRFHQIPCRCGTLIAPASCRIAVNIDVPDPAKWISLKDRGRTDTPKPTATAGMTRTVYATGFFPYRHTCKDWREWFLRWSRVKNAQQPEAQAAPMHQPPRTSVG
jgi:hypothetical protein